jgi:hypothetical protein
LLGVHTEERAWRVGAKGEQLVAGQLERLGPSWHVIHSVTLSETGTDLDHLVIGPAGVFCLNTKSHPDAKVWVAGDTFLVNGHRPEHNYVRASRSEGRKVSRVLTAACGFDVAVQPVVVVVNAAGLEVKEQPVDVRICSRRRIIEWLRSQPQVLSLEQVAVVFSVARRSTTWLQHQGNTGNKRARAAIVALPAPLASSSAPASDQGVLRASTVSPPVTVSSKLLFIDHGSAKGTILRGDPRPHSKLVSAAGFRWRPQQRSWYLAESRDLPPRLDLIHDLAEQLRAKGFEVRLEFQSNSGEPGGTGPFLGQGGEERF